MKKTIVITSIFAPTEGVRKFAEKSDYNLLVVGDKKSPTNWESPGVSFISLEEQMQGLGRFAELMPLNCYARKNLGYVKAIQDGAQVIVDTDDDNIPYGDWAFPEFTGEYDSLSDDLGMVNIYQLFSKQKIWPRGLELNLINTDFGLDGKLSKSQAQVGIWQGLADKDPDVDAIYRLTSDEECTFDKRAPVVLGKGTLCPYNSQNTTTLKELFPLLYLPFTVSFRYTDILRSWVAQPIMWAHGYKLGFTEASVYQERNAHDYVEDFKSEISMYVGSKQAIEIATSIANAKDSIEDNLFNVYEGLLKAGIVEQAELDGINAWLEAINKTS
ncbi:MAG: STELLO glycosyltransferase family protein [Gammaproteobacteria bacterium]|nr:STELLO glycosyltransferase family protein [Gammaproteobacteria bacterium]